jgi:small-conductance mechanosensitive channel
VVRTIPGYFYFVFALYFSLRLLVIDDGIMRIFKAVFLILLVYQVIRVIQMFLQYGVVQYISKKEGRRLQQAETTAYGVSIIFKFVLWSIGILLILANLGVNVTSLIAGLGIGGVAIALAVQNILGDIFSSFSIYFDRPFEVGDYIMIGGDEGTVKMIGIQSTRIETLNGEELIVPNREIASSRVQNFKKMKRRRALMKFGVTYDTSADELRKVNEIVKKVIDSVDGVEFSRSHFSTFGDYSLEFDVVYYILSAEYIEYMNCKQEINLGIKEGLEKEGIEIPYPTQTVMLKK